MSVSDNGSFLTALEDLIVPLRGNGKKHKDDRLIQSRRDHKKLMEVVNAFGEKVGGMIDSQRSEFMTAYEHHMIDVQRELQSLREKVATIESDATLTSKLDSLDAAQKRYKDEALYLDAETLDLKKMLRKVVGVLHSVEKERDWYLKRLREAKKEYNRLLKERAKVGGEGLDTSSIYSGSNDSQYTLLIRRNSGTTIGDLKARLKNVYGVSRDQALLSTLPHILPTTLQPLQDETINSQNLHQQPKAYSASGKESTLSKRVKRSEEDKKALGELVALKARRETLRAFVSSCASSCDKGPWARIPRRPIVELLTACMEIANDPDTEAREEERLILAFELAGLPETYFAIADLITKKIDGDLGPKQQGLRCTQWQVINEDDTDDYAFDLDNNSDDGAGGNFEFNFTRGFFADGDEVEDGGGDGTGGPYEDAPPATESNQTDSFQIDEELMNYLAAAKEARVTALRSEISNKESMWD